MAATTLDNFNKFNLTSCKFPATNFEYDSRDAIIYALGRIHPEDEYGLEYLFEGHRNFQVFPVYGVMLSTGETFKLMRLKGLKIKLENILHLEQYIEQHRPLASSAKGTLQLEVVDVLDRKVGSQYVYRTIGRDEKGRALFTSEGSIFVKGDGDFGGKARTDKPMKKTMLKPDRRADAILTFEIPRKQAAIFRLSGDLHPLHIDPEFAKLANFDRPILHGNCTMGIAAQLILKKYAGGDARRFKSMMVRFSSVVFPGNVLQVNTWKEGNCIQFEVKSNNMAAEDAAITGGYVNILELPMER